MATTQAETKSSELTGTLYGGNYGIIADGVTDNTAAFNTFLAALKSTGFKGLLPPGTIMFNSKPNDIDFPLDLGGEGIVTTVLIRNYSEVGGASVGFFNLISGTNGTRIHDMAIESEAGTSGGSIICAISPASYAISAIIFENLWVTTRGSNTHLNTIYMDGTAKITGAIGVRDVSFKNVHCFGANGYSVNMQGVVGCSWNGGGIYPAGGTNAASGGLAIGGTVAVNSSYFNFNIVTSAGLNLTHCQNLNLSIASVGVVSGISVNNDTTCQTTSVIGTPSGSVLTNWLSSQMISPGNVWTTGSGTVASSATPTINTFIYNRYYFSITALATNITSMSTNLSGTPIDGYVLWISIQDDGSTRSIAWGASYESSTVTLPTVTTASTRMDVGFVYNAKTGKYRCVAVS